MVQVTKTMTAWELEVRPENKSKWERLAAVVDPGAAENVLPVGVCNHVKLSATRRSDAGIGFRGAGGERIRNHGQRKFKVRMRDEHVAGTTWQVADVKRPLTSVAKMVAAGNRVHLDSKDPRIVRPKGDVIPLRKAGNVFVVDLWVRKDATSRRPGFHRAGLSPEVCPTDDGPTIRPVRNEGAARERNVVGFDLGGVDAQEECKVGPHAEEEPDMDCESDGGEDGERVRLLPKPRTPSKAEWERHVVSHMPFRDFCRHCVARRGLERRHQRHPGHDDQHPVVCIDCGCLSGDATPMLVAKDRRIGMVFALPVERKGAADPHDR